MDWRVDKVAEIMVNYSTSVKKGDLVLIRVLDPVAEPLALAVQKHTLQAGGNPVYFMSPSQAAEVLYRYGSDEQIEWVNPAATFLWENADVMITLIASQNTKALSTVDPARLSRAQKARGPLSETFMRRQATGELRWTLTQYPCQSSAQDAEMSLLDYEDFVYGACMVHLDDPVGYWLNMAKEQDRLVNYLKGKEMVEVKGENIDLTLSIKDRTFINADGKKNFPDGEIFTGPVEDSVNGWVKFTYPAIYNGREVEGVEIHFENGKAVKSTAAKGDDFLNTTLNTDDGSRFLGEFAIGTNRGVTQFTRNILFDEKMGGTVHMAFGASYPDTGAKNHSAVHWDMICDMRTGGEIRVDGELFYKNGEFTL
jgi:aminopeptidase